MRMLVLFIPNSPVILPLRIECDRMINTVRHFKEKRFFFNPFLTFLSLLAEKTGKLRNDQCDAVKIKLTLRHFLQTFKNFRFNF